MYAEDGGHVDLTPLSGSLEEVFAVLPPLSPAPTRELFLATDFGWTVFLRNSILGADPALTMRRLSRRLGVVAMRVCLSGGVRRHPSVMWEMYAPPALGGDARGRRRSIAAANDGGSWVFHQSGAPFDFEDVARYAAPRIRDRFTPDMLAAYLARLGVPPISDERLRVGGVARALLLSRPPHAHSPQYSLEELAAGKPWAKK